MIENLSKRKAKSLSYILYIIYNDNKNRDIKPLKDFIERYK